MGMGIVSGILTARFLLPEGKGELTAVLLWIGLFHIFGTIGMGQSTVYFTGKSSDRFSKLVGTASTLAVILGSIIGVVGFFAIPFILVDYPESTVWMAQIIFLWSPIQKLTAFAQRMLQGRGFFWSWNVTRVIQKTTYVLGIVVLWLVSWLTVENALWAYLVGEFAVFSATMLLLRPHICGLQFEFGLARRMLKYGVTNYLASLTNRANHDVDQAVISTLLGAKALGLYKVALSSSKLISPISSGFKRVLISDVSRSDDDDQGDAFIRDSLSSALPVMTLAAVVTGVAMPWLVPFAFGVEYSGSVIPAQILVGAIVIYGFKQILYNGLRGKGRPDIPLKAELVALVVTVVGLYLVLQWAGIVGAAAVTAVAYGVGVLAAAWMFMAIRDRADSSDTSSTHEGSNE